MPKDAEKKKKFPVALGLRYAVNKKAAEITGRRPMGSDAPVTVDGRQFVKLKKKKKPGSAEDMLGSSY